MSKAVMISIQPKWCELIASGKKTIEVRKTAPTIHTPFKCYIYQTKKKWIYKLLEKLGLHQGKVIGEFVCDRIDTIESEQLRKSDPSYEGRKAYYNALAYTDLTCISYDELSNYVGYGISRCYGLHISNLVIYNKPKELGEFEKPCDYSYNCRYCNNATHFTNFLDLTTQSNGFIPCNRHLSRSPQSYFYVEEEIEEWTE